MHNEYLSSQELIHILHKQTSPHFYSITNNRVMKLNAATNEYAAVLILIIETKEGLKVLLTKRAQQLSHHAGQISFPGGKFATADKNLLTTALRETHEETGLLISSDNVMGYFSEYITISEFFKVRPFIAVCNEAVLNDLNPAPEEVDEIIIAPLAYFLKDTHYQQRELIRNERKFFYKEINYLNYKIWGLTANIFHDFSIVINSKCS